MDSVNSPLTYDEIAQVCHEANRAYCQILGDNTQPHWDKAPEWQRESAINGVRFHCMNPGQPPSASHDNWMREKEADGWSYGPKKDPAKKQHPCFLPYADLPADQKLKDKLFIGVVVALRTVETEYDGTC